MNKLIYPRVRRLVLVLACLLPAPLLAEEASVQPVAPKALEDKSSKVAAAKDFPWFSYKYADIDAVHDADTQVETGVTPGYKIWSPPKKMHFTATLLSYPESCDLGKLPEFLSMSGTSLDSLPKITTCIRIKSAKEREMTVFIQDQLNEYLSRAIKLESQRESQLEVYVDYVYASEVDKSLGLVVNEFRQPQRHTDKEPEPVSPPSNTRQPVSLGDDKTRCLELKTNAEIAACAARSTAK